MLLYGRLESFCDKKCVRHKSQWRIVKSSNINSELDEGSGISSAIDVLKKLAGYVATNSLRWITGPSYKDVFGSLKLRDEEVRTVKKEWV